MSFEQSIFRLCQTRIRQFLSSRTGFRHISDASLRARMVRENRRRLADTEARLRSVGCLSNPPSVFLLIEGTENVVLPNTPFERQDGESDSELAERLFAIHSRNEICPGVRGFVAIYKPLEAK